MQVLENYTVPYTTGRCGTSYKKRVYHIVDRHVHSNFKELKESGSYIPPLPYYLHKEVIIDPPGEWSKCTSVACTHFRHYDGNVTSCFGGAKWQPVQSTQNITLKLRAKMEETDWNAAMSWFERKESFKMITKRSVQLVRALRLVRKGKFKRASDVLEVTLSQRAKKRLNRRDRLDQFSENWLEYQYGWKPFLGDIYSAADFIAKGTYRLANEAIRIRASATDFKSGGVHQLNGFFPGWSFEGGQDYSRRRVGGGVDYTIVDPEYRMQDAMGLKNPLLIAWELVPFSFVADWFNPIGTSLAELTAYKGLHFVGGYMYTLEQDHLSFSRATNWPKYHAITQAQFSADRTIFVRTPFYSFDKLNVNPWTTSNGLNPKRAMDAITILQRVLRGYAT